MSHLETELIKLKKQLAEMWELVISQVEKSRDSVVNFDKQLASEIRFREKMVDMYELKIDRDCESIIALLTPVAVDLRMVLSVLKINTNLERIADFAKGIAKFVVECPREKCNEELIKSTKIEEVLNNALEMLKDVREAWEQENSQLAFAVFAKDELINQIYKGAPEAIANYIKQNPEQTVECLNAYSILRKVERMGDHCNNISEEIIFYLDAKILKHNKKLKQGNL
jgi:phosphate transport system protein